MAPPVAGDLALAAVLAFAFVAVDFDFAGAVPVCAAAVMVSASREMRILCMVSFLCRSLKRAQQIRIRDGAAEAVPPSKPIPRRCSTDHNHLLLLLSLQQRELFAFLGDLVAHLFHVPEDAHDVPTQNLL